jgi:predicted AAA+ superfamily ATPase
MDKILKSLAGINYWDTVPHFSLGFRRGSYIRNIEKGLGNKLIKVIVGQRRAGKSYIVRQLINMLINEKNVNPVNIFYLNKEMFEFEDIQTAADLSDIINLFEEKYSPKGILYIFIDEIQNISNWEKIIVSLAQHPVKQYELFITGSNSKILSSELATFLSGRYIITEVFPFSYKEFLEYKSLENNKTNFIKYISTSALPEIFNLEHTETIRHYFQSLKDTILLKDIMQRHQIRDYVLLEDIFLFLLHNVGNMTSVPSIVRYFKSKKRKADYSTISAYISYMEEAFIIHKAPRYSLKTKELLSGEKKYFINDIGFRNYLYPQLIKETGAILENLVFMHLKMRKMDIKLGYENNFGVDFYASNDIETSYIQVSYVMPTQRIIAREFGALEKIDDNFPKYVVSMDDLLISSQKGIIHQQVWNYVYNLCE